MGSRAGASPEQLSEQNQPGCCLVEETQMITKKWNDNCDSQPETAWRTSDPDRHSGKGPLRRPCSSWDQIQEVLDWCGCVSVCVCVTPVQKEPPEPGPVVGRGPGAGNMVWLRGASSCRGSARGRRCELMEFTSKKLGRGSERRFGES